MHRGPINWCLANSNFPQEFKSLLVSSLYCLVCISSVLIKSMIYDVLCYSTFKLVIYKAANANPTK